LPLQIETGKDKKGLVETKEKNVLKIPIVFTPRESLKYNETVTFDINGLHKIDVKITGEGIPFKLELEKTEDQNLDFGVVRVGKESQKSVLLQNLSKKPVNLTFDTGDQLKELEKYFVSVLP
jgi:hydrocephalus-inducing protein